MTRQIDPKQELQKRLAENSLEDEFDLMAYVQYASRLAALGDDGASQNIPSLFAAPKFAGRAATLLEERCEQGIWDCQEYDGEHLALAIIDAQDFFCFERRMGDTMPDLKTALAPAFADWWEAAEYAEINAEAASLLEDFLATYPIPKEERLDVVDNPITESEREWLHSVADKIALTAKPLRIASSIDTKSVPAAPMIVYACDSGEDETVGPPPAHWVPFVGVREDDGKFGFLSVDLVPKIEQSRDMYENDELRKHAFNAAEFVFELFRSLDHNLGSPVIGLHCAWPGEGSSLSLPAMMAALSRILGITWPSDIIATGCFEKFDDGGVLKPVAVDSLQTKIDVALQHGYKTLVLVDGQTVPENAGIATKIVHSDPLIALFDLQKLAENVGESESRAARLLAVFANKKIRSMSFQDIEKIVSRFCKSESRLVRHVACDILSRAALHEGKTEHAEKYARDAGQLAWHEIPTDWLGHYIRYEEIASRAEVAIDGGTWDRTHNAHRELNQRLGMLVMAKRRGCAGADDLFAMLALYNTRAQRKQFLARMTQDKKMLRRAWDDFFSMFTEWDKLFAYCKRIGRTDSTFERQRNYCLSALADAKRLGESLVPDGDSRYMLQIIERRGEFVRNDGFDRVAWLDWHFVTGKTPSSQEIDVLLDEADEAYAKERGREHPNFLVYEKLLRYGYVTPTQRSHCVSQLAKAAHLAPAPTSILTLLALRTREVLAQNGNVVATPRVLPLDGTPLRKTCDDLLSDVSTLIARAPY